MRSVLALHGFTGCGEDFARFSPLCHTVDAWHCPNLPGHGAKPQLDCSPAATLSFTDEESAGSNILLGYSMGARAALQHATEYPNRWDALVLISPNPGIEDEKQRNERRNTDEKLAARIENDGVATFIEFWQNTPMIRSQKKIRPDWRAQMQENRALHTAEGLSSSLRQFGQGNCPNLWPELQKLSIPVLLIVGAEDLKYSQIAGRMMDSLSCAVCEIIDEVGHMPHLEDPEICADIIDDFLREFS